MIIEIHFFCCCFQKRVRSRKATLDEIQICHSEAYTLLFGSSLHNRHKIDPAKLGNHIK